MANVSHVRTRFRRHSSSANFFTRLVQRTHEHIHTHADTQTLSVHVSTSQPHTHTHTLARLRRLVYSEQSPQDRMRARVGFARLARLLSPSSLNRSLAHSRPKFCAQVGVGTKVCSIYLLLALLRCLSFQPFNANFLPPLFNSSASSIQQLASLNSNCTCH